MNYIIHPWNRPLRSTLIDTLDSINCHEMGIIDDKALEYALNDLKEAVVQDSKDLVRYIKEGTATKNNAMIARFMGIQDTDIGWYDCEDVMPECVHIQEGGNTFENLWFHKEWNWLMPVVEKCLTTEDSNHYRLNNALLNCNAEEVYKAVVEFIKAHTQTNTQ